MASAPNFSRGGDAFIQLGRTFHELSSHAREADDIELGDAFRVGGSLQWGALLEEFRVVLLSEAGSGKTEELRHIAKSLRADNKAAFFLRLENVADDFDLSFEEGTLEEFQAWVAGNEEGWLFLDSIDEARLKSPKDFELAIRRVSQRVQTAKDRAHVLITGRTTAWRPKTDLEFCAAQLPCIRPTTTERAEEATGNEDWLESDDASGDITETDQTADKPGAEFKIVTLDDLNREQIGLFVAARGISNRTDFLDAIERADAWSFTTRPQDLADLADFWLSNGRIGSRVEVLQNSIDRRLRERDQDRAEARPLSIDRVRAAVRLLAGAATLTKDPSLRVPDGTENTKGVHVQEVLSDWTEADQTSLLSRPVFDEAIYGTLRFHHRSVREFLAAEWLAHLLSRSSSRRAIEGLFFREQYGLAVITPSLRPILPWLAMMDGPIQRRVLKTAPEVLLEGGDPSQLPLEVRRQILNDLGSQIAIGVT